MCAQLSLSPPERALLDEARRATLGTVSPDGSPRLVPICFAVHPRDPVLYVAIDDKPKRSADPHRLARVRDIATDSRVTILADRWSEDWARLAWVRCHGRATFLEPSAPDDGERRDAIAALRERYPAYRQHDLEVSLVLRIEIDRTTAWGDL